MTVRQHGGDSAPHGTRGALVTLPEAVGLLALFAFAVYFLFRAPHHRTPTYPIPPGAAHAAKEAKPLDPQRVAAIYNILCSKDQQIRKTKGKREYSIGIITALQEEFRAAISMLDEEHNAPSDFQKPPEDSNDYVWGRIAQHNVVIVSFPSGIYGTSIAARVATLLVSSFPSIRLGFMVGIGGGVPSPSYDIRLGDVVVSKPGQGTAGGVVQYDLGKEEEGKFRRTGSLNKPPSALLSALTSFQARPRILELCETIRHASTAIYQAFEFDQAAPTYAYQGSENDRLFETTSTWTVLPWQSARPTERRERPRPEVPTIHYGLIASGNRVMKNGRERDNIVSTLRGETNGGECLCFEMEAAGLMDNFPCLVIRGISDYADSHKSHSWHGYASMTAAAFARELLHVLKPTEVESSTKACEIMAQVRQATVKKIKEWLAPSDHTKNFEDAQEARYSKTNTWLFEHNTYRSWLSGDFDCLWLHGPSGCGKTVLSSTMIDTLMKNGVCLYYFFDFRDEKKQTLRELLLSLVFQLYSTSNGPREILHRLYSSRDWNQTKPSTDSLIRAFDIMLQQSGQVQLVLDALDESKKGRDREELLHWLHRQIHPESRRCKFRIIITSRSGQQDIMDTVGVLIPERATLSVEENASKVKDDIRKYIERRLIKDAMFARWRNQPWHYTIEAVSQLGEQFVSEDQSCSEIEFEPEEVYQCEDFEFDTLADEHEWDPILRKARDVLVQKAGTMFRWASLQLDSLGSLGSSAKIEEALADLPEGLNDIYARSLTEIPKRHRDDAVRILEIILASTKPLTVETALELISVDLKAALGHSINAGKKMKDLAPFSSLISVFIKTRPGYFGDQKLLEIAHSSVRDYLCSGTLEPCLKVGFSDNSSKATLLRICLAYWGSIEPRYSQEHGPSSVGYYVGNEWLRLAKKEEVENEAYDDILRFLLHSGTLKMRNSGSAYTGPPLYLAARVGLPITLKRLLKYGITPNELGGDMSTIRTNSYYKKKLTEFRADLKESIGSLDVNAKGENYTYALHAASQNGDSKIVELLLKNGADVNAQDQYHETALCLACSFQGDSHTVRLLLDYGADVNAIGKHSTPLYTASFMSSLMRGFDQGVEKYSGLMKILLDHGADPNRTGRRKSSASALILAAGVCRPWILQSLLEKGADINYQPGKSLTALDNAIEKRNFGAIQVLIENGANLDLLSDDHQRQLLGAKSRVLQAQEGSHRAEVKCFTPIVVERLEEWEKSVLWWRTEKHCTRID